MSETDIVKADQATTTTAITTARVAARDQWAVLVGQARAIAHSGMFQHVKGEDQAIAYGMWAEAHKVPFITAVQQCTFINGKVGMEADLMHALVLQSGKGRIEYVESTDATCTVQAVRGDRVACEVTWDIARAESAGLTGRGGMYAKYPRQMLRHRAVAEACRAAFPDVLGGVYTREEVDEIAAGAVVMESRTEAIARAAGVATAQDSDAEADKDAGPVGAEFEISDDELPE